MSFSTFTRSVRIERSAAEVFAWHEKPGAFERLAPPWQKLRVLARRGGIRSGATVSLSTKIGPCWVRWDVEHRDYIEGVQFRDVQLRGPFKSWEHLHRIESVDGGRACVLTDTITYQLPFGFLGRVGGAAMARGELEKLFNYRHAVTKSDLELSSRYIAVRPMRFLLAGASGLVGRALVPFLKTQGHSVMRLVRRPVQSDDEVFWDPSRGQLDGNALRGVDVVINLAGAGIADARWSEERKLEIMRSRIESTRTLVQAMGQVKSERLRPFALISASAIGFYGNRGNERLSEKSVGGEGFLAEVCANWEREAMAAEELGVRTVCLRTGVVLTPAGGALAKMLPVFKLGLGGPVGSREAWMSWISIDDMIGAIYHAVLDRRCQGPMNTVAPTPVTMGEFARVLGQVLRRPAILPVPAGVVRTIFGEMAEQTLLASTRVNPQSLRGAHYDFRHEKLEAALRHGLGLL